MAPLTQRLLTLSFSDALRAALTWGAILVTTVVFCTIVYRLCFHPLAKFPGPNAAKVSGIWRDRRFWRGSWHDDILEAHKKYGPVVRVAPNELSIVDENVSKLLYSHGTKAVKTNWYDTWKQPTAGPALFNETDKHQHSFLRKRVSAVYSMSAMLRYEEYMQKDLDLMIEKLKKHAIAGHVVNMSDWTEMLAFDIVGELTYGSALGQLDSESDAMGIRKSIHSGFYVMTNMGHYPGQSLWLTHPLVVKTLTALGASPFGSFGSWTLQRIRERQGNEGKAEREDMLFHFLRMKAANGEPATQQEVLIEALNIIGAGADTTSVAMRACLYYLCKHPQAYAKVQKEIDDYHINHKLERPLSYQQTLELPYFCAAVREAIRLFPSIVYPLLRYAVPGMEVDGKQIPVGASVGVSPIAANRNRKIWGPDADEFKPERWLESEEKTRYLNSNDMTFGGNGPRTCIGRNLALVELHKFLAQLLRAFDVDFANPDKPWRVFSVWFANQYDMYMKIRYRWSDEKTV